jgi:hypothetical protein
MKYFKLGEGMLASINNSGKVAIFAKGPWRKQADTFKNAIVRYENNALSFQPDLTFLKRFFPTTKQIKKNSFERGIREIDEYNEVSDGRLEEIKRIPIEEVNTYIAMYPVRYPDLLTFRELDRIILLGRLRIDGAEISIYDEEDDATYSPEVAYNVFGLLSEAALTRDRQLIEDVLIQIPRGVYENSLERLSNSMGPTENVQDRINTVYTDISADLDDFENLRRELEENDG